GQEILDLGDVVSVDLASMGSLRSALSELETGLNTTSPEDVEKITNISRDLDVHLSEVLGHDPVPEFSPEMESRNDYFEGFDDVGSMKEEMSDLLSFSFSSGEMENATGDVMNFSMRAPSLMSDLNDAVVDLDEMMDNRSLTEGSKLELSNLREKVQDVISRVENLTSLSMWKGNPMNMGQLQQSFYYGQYILTNFLTKDFDPVIGSLNAEGAMILVSLDYELVGMSDTDNEKLLDIEGNLSAIVGDFNDVSDLTIHPMGFGMIDEKITEASNESMMILGPLAMLFVFVILLLIYRSFFDMVLNLIALVFAILWMYGFGSLMGYSSNPMIMAVPVLLIGLGIDYGIHLTMRYREEI
ncbi:MAG: MMPL family transporter, partial [Candidatus Thermoplasmatota archaeon]|nr:MMPL family transporter [Candidatus Thermoplasmatota archaeon]